MNTARSLLNRKFQTRKRLFFFEKKNQKTFVSAAAFRSKVRDSQQKFFALRRAGFAFFQKRGPFFHYSMA
jgi:hypothetical protein